ncbi:MAG: DUF5692 family protein [Vibrio metschnikovii]|nr:DUF5692 family protein [Vibrio metschnikovii]MDM7484593.1 DUF5692 family protein [Vibrio metschnikovii]
MKLLIKTLLVMLLAMTGTIAIAQDQGYSSDQLIGEIWQGTHDGAPGEGSLFFRLEFHSEGLVSVMRQSGGFNKTEIQNWHINDSGNIVIKSNPDDQITNFDNASLRYTEREQMRYTLDDSSSNFYKWHKTNSYLHILFVLFGLILLNELCRHWKHANYLLWFILPIALIPIFASHEITYWFKWVKLYSVVGAAVLFTLIRFTKIGSMKWAKFSAAAFLALNILEAVLQDFSMGNLANILNAVGGILCIITLAGWAQIKADDSKQKDMIWPAMTTFWIIAYDIWNIVFVYLNFPGSATAQAMVLIAATLPSLLIKKGTWLQARAFTLAGSFMYYFAFPSMYESHVIPLPRNDELMLAAGLISFIVNLAYAIFFFRKTKEQRIASAVA